MHTNVMNTPEFLAHTLLECFFSECESKFRFLELKHNFSYINGVYEYKNNCKVIKAYRGQALGESFLAVTRYERDDLAIEILFGDKQFSIECFIFYGPIQRFSLSEILIAGRKSGNSMPIDWGLTEASLVSAAIERIAKNVQSHIKLLLEPSDKMIGRALSIRHSRLESAIRKNFAETLKILSLEAARAYREKNYRQVVHILEPYKNYLAQAELKKLQLAKTQLLS